MFALPLGQLSYALNIMYFLFIYINYRGNNHRKPCAQKHGSKPMGCACHKQNRVPKTMVRNPWFCPCHKHEESYKNPSRACVNGGSICDITITITINIFFFFLFIFFSYIVIFLFSIIPRTSSPIHDPGGHSSSTPTRESSRHHLVNPM